jgi:enoyl-CoA hydratase/carnithine racemase
VEADAFEAQVQSLVDTLSQMAPLALAQTKKSLNEIAAGLYNEPALKERSRQSAYSQDFAEGRAAFAERRAPKFKGC